MFKGVNELSEMSGEFPATITATKINSVVTDILIELEYTGESITTVFGKKITKGVTYRLISFPVHFYQFQSKGCL